MMRLAFVAAGGAVGAVLRYLVSGAVHSLMGPVFPWGTLSVNLIGCFAIGVLWGLFDATTVSPNVRAGVLLGILGSFTTFSTFGFESLNLLRSGETTMGIVNLLASNVLGVLLVYVGLVISGHVVSSLR
jgi:fluoride exporter